MPNPAEPSDLAARWRPLTEAEAVIAPALLGDAWAELEARVPRLDERLAAGDVSTELVTRVVSAMVIRVLRNPEGIRQFSIDDYTQVRDQLLSAGLLYATGEEIALLTPGRRSIGLGTIRLGHYC